MLLGLFFVCHCRWTMILLKLDRHSSVCAQTNKRTEIHSSPALSCTPTADIICTGSHVASAGRRTALPMIHSHYRHRPRSRKRIKSNDSLLLVIITRINHAVYCCSFCYHSREGGKAILRYFPNCGSSHGWTSGINNISGKSGS